MQGLSVDDFDDIAFIGYDKTPSCDKRTAPLKTRQMRFDLDASTNIFLKKYDGHHPHLKPFFSTEIIMRMTRCIVTEC